MSDFSKIINCIFLYYIKFRTAILIINIGISVLLGYFFIGPFFTSDVYFWLKSEISSNKLTANLVDIQSLLVDKIITSSIPLLILWASVFFCYSYNFASIKHINQASRFLAILSSGTAQVTLMIGFTIFSTCIYGAVHLGLSQSFYIAIFSALLIILAGFFIRYYGKPILKENAVLRKTSTILFISCTLLAISFYLYSVFAEPIQLIYAIYDAYRNR